MLNHTFTFNGHSSDEFGIKIERFRALNKPARKHDAASVPGRNGNIYKLQDAYEEVPMNYQIFAGGARNAMEFEDARIASFINNSLNKPLTSLIAEIDPIQSGSGDPSPTNVKEISGRTSVKIYKTGKNLLPYPYYHTTMTQNGVTFTDNGDGSITVTGTATATTNFFVVRASQAIKFPTGQTYTLSGCPTGGSSSTYGLIAYAKGADDSNIYAMSDYGNGVSKTFEADIEDEYVATYITIRIYNGQTVNLTFHPMFRLASDSAEWESPVDNETKSISLGRTVYGGTLNVVSGLLTVDRKYVEYDGSSDEPWAVINYGYRIGLGAGNNGVTNSTKNIANWMVQADSAHNPTSSAGISGTFTIGGYFNINVSGISSITDVTTLKTYLASNPLQVVYELATPVTYQLTPTEVKTLLGKNNIWANSGNLRDLVVPAVTLEDVFTEIMEWLNSADGYAELTDTYDTTHYREAVFVDATDIENSWNTFGRAIVSFRCRPERFLNSGRNMVLDFTNTTLIGYVNTWSLTLRESAPSGAYIKSLNEGEVLKILDSVVISSVEWYQVKTEDGTIGWCESQYVLTYNVLIVNNPTKHIAKPKITLTMRSGGLWMMLNRSILEVTGQAYPLYIDCEMENITGINGLGQPESYNNRTTLSDEDGNPISNFLSLKSGENYISIEESENVSDVTIEPRFWEI